MQSRNGQSTNTSVFGYRKLNTTALKMGNVPKWVPDKDKPFKYAPSAFMYEIGLSTEERTALQMRESTIPKILEFLDMGQTSYQKDSIVDVNRPLFDAQPSEIIFQQFEPPASYEITLSLRNIDKVARSVKLLHEESPYFTVIPPKPGGNKVAPGMVAAYTIKFTPDEKKDYHHQLVCITEREKFLIPVRAIGPRAVLDFPDELHFNTSPVKYVSTKTVLIRNVGNCEGKFIMDITSPFTVEPMEGSLGVGEYMQLHVDFKPKKVGDHTGTLTVAYNTGEEVCIKLYGGSCDANVRMDKSSVKLDNTFIGMTSQRSVTIHNRSDVVVRYEWKALATEEDEQVEKEIRVKTLNAEESLAKEAFTKECFRDPTVRDRMSMLTRAFNSRKKQYVDDERFMYYDEIISIEPLEGEIWPNSQAEVSIVFTPDEPISYNRTVFCDVTGRETRLPLRIKGEGLGPKLQFSFDSLNIENVFVNSSHAYEIILENKGGIEAMYNITPSSNSLFGPNFTFSPNEGVLHPGGLQAIQISFCSAVLGEFDEVFLLTADGSPDPVKLRISGKVIGPTFQFDVSEIKFGLVSCGFVNTAEVTLCNTSEVPMTYRLRVPSDGTKEAQAIKQDNNKGPDTATTGATILVKEFTIRPRSGTIPPDLTQDIQVDFTPMSIKNYSVVLVVDVEGVGEEVFSLPISAKSVVPQIGLVSPYIDYGRCFIGCPCTHHAELVNSTTLPARYQLQPRAEDDFAVYSSTSPKGVIMSNSILKVPIQIEVKRLGEMLSPLSFTILGGSDSLNIELHYIGEGPVVSVFPTHLNWGKCPVLTPAKKIITLSNQSVINAEFECVMTRDKTVFSVDPVTGVVPAEGTLELVVTAELDDSIRFTDKLTIVVFQGVSHTLNLIAEGQGTTIVSQPPLHPMVDLGPHFSSRPCSQEFVLTNCGRRKHSLYWVTEGFSIVKLRRAEIANETTDMLDVGFTGTSKTANSSKRPIFQVVPDKLELDPQESKTITVEGHCMSPQIAKEKLLCYAIIGRTPHKEHIMSVDITTNFISPLLKFSKEELHFQSVLPPGSKLQVLSQSFGALNVSPLPVTAMLTSNYPFLFASGDEAVPRMELRLDVDEAAKLLLQFDPAYRPDRHSRTHNSSLEVSYKEHPHKDYISLKSEVHFPNVHFEKQEIDFGCILNDTESSLFVMMTNTSPLPVCYHWYFLEQPPVVRSGDPANDDEGIDVNSELEDDVESVKDNNKTEQELDDSHHSEPESVASKPSHQQQEELEQQQQVEDEEKQVEEGENTVPQSSLADQPPPKEAAVLLQSPRHPHIILDDSNRHSKLLFKCDTLPEDREEMCPLEHPVEQPVEQQAQSIYSEDVGSPEKVDDVKSKANESVSSAVSDHQPQPWELVTDPFVPIRIEQIFDILPLHGTLPCGQSQEVQFMFYGHADISCSVVAACKVEGGPTYRLTLTGEASRVEYKFSKTIMDVGTQLYDKVIKEEITLTNVGKVTFNFSTVGVPESGDLSAGGITVSPSSGSLPALEQQKLTIRYLPGMPDTFSKSFEIKVAHFKPETITLVGEGVFPRLSLHLPRLNKGDYVEDVRLIEQDVVKQFAVDNQDIITSAKSSGKKSAKPRPEMPPFVLDFGYVVYGCIDHRSVTLTNIGYPLISFTSSQTALNNTGFSVDIVERVKNLPGTPDCESIEFKVKFDPASAQCAMGKVEARLPFNLVGGPVYWLHMTAIVTLPDLTLSTDHVNFDTIQCGQCKVVTIRIKNPYHISCEWNAVTEKPKKKPPKYVPLHLKKKLKEPQELNCFELHPISGLLQPEEWVNIKVKFMPSEEATYTKQIPIKVTQNPDSGHVLLLEGVGSEPRISFSQPLLEFGPVFPFSQGDYQDVFITNPTSFPLEIYSLEYDAQYIEEEEILRWVKGYSKQKTILLPPREVGDKLPAEVVSAYESEQYNVKARSSLLAEPDSSASSPSMADITPSNSQLQVEKLKGDFLSAPMLDVPQSTSLTSSISLSPPITNITAFESTSHLLRKLEQGEDSVELQSSPVCTALAKHMGVDISPEAKLAETRRGVVIIVYGPVMSGKTTQTGLLAETYGGKVLNIDEVIIDAISKANTSAGKRARESCIEAMIAPAENTPASNVTGTESIAPKKKGDKDKSEQPLPSEPVGTLQCESPQPFQVDPVCNTSSLNIPNSTLMPTRLPEECVVEILSERLQQPDCQKGAVFDGLTSQFISTHQTTAALILKATNNRKYIFFVNLKMTLDDIKQRERAIEEERLNIERMEEERRLAEEKAQRDEEARLDQLSEDEYEALSEEVKAQIDARRLKARREKIRQREEQQKLLRQKQALEEAKKEEEGRDKSRKNKRKSKIVTMKAEAKPESIKSSRPPSASSIGKQPSLVFRTSALGGLGSNVSLDRAVSPSDSPSEVNLTVKTKKKQRRTSTMFNDDSMVSETGMDKRYKLYEDSIVGLNGLMENWIRALGEVKPKRGSEATSGQEETPTHTTSKRKSRKEIQVIEIVPELVVPPSNTTGVSTGDLDGMEGVGIPIINATASATVAEVFNEVYSGGVLPCVEEVMDGMGLGPDGPPLPPPYLFSVITYPQLLRSHQENVSNHFEFVASSPNDPNAAAPEDVSKPVSETDLPEYPEPEQTTTTSGRTSKKSSQRSIDSTDTSSKGKLKAMRSQKGISPDPSLLFEEESARSKSASPAMPSKLAKFRWIIPANSQISLKMKFISDEVGQIDQTFTFEIVGTRRKYQLFCRGHAIFPSISREPRVVFTNRKNAIREGEIVQKKYVLSQEKYIFGPLHCGKTRERYREGRYPENMEKLTISNASPIVCNANFCFEQDTNASTFLLDPPGMVLQPGQSKELTVWAYPKASKHYEDNLVCCMKHNPVPAVFPISCDGVQPELEVNTKLIQFEKVLLHRKETRSLFLRNNTLLPVQWKLSGLDVLGNDFSFNQEYGIVQPKSEFELKVHFRASKANNYKRALKLEISDVEQIVGLMHVETIQIHAEAYDVAIDISFSRGADGGLDFQCIRVGDEAKQSIQLKNKGKYDIEYKIMLDIVDGVDLSKYFTTQPTRGILYPGEKPTSVFTVFKAEQEITIKDQPVLKCQVVEPHLGDGDTIANIPIRISARAVFSMFTITPVSDINFGSIILHSKKTCSFVMENKGEFEFKYAVTKITQDKQRSKGKDTRETRTKSHDGQTSSQLLQKSAGGAKGKVDNTLRNEVPTVAQRLVIGMFTLHPAGGIISAGSSQTINIDCVAETQGKTEEIVAIDISGRPTTRGRNPPPMQYKIYGEVLLPGINYTDMVSVFEEHRICRKLGLISQHHLKEDGSVGVYGEDDRRFVFHSVIVGQVARAQYKISNPNKILCDVHIAVKPLSGKGSSKGMAEGFDVEPTKASIPPHSQIYATVSFKPTSMQLYSGQFETTVDGPPMARSRVLTFEVQGEGSLPQVTVMRPTVRNNKGFPLLLYKRLLIGKTQTLPLVLKNEGNITATAILDVVSGSKSFNVTTPSMEETPTIVPSSTQSPPLTMDINVGKEACFNVNFSPSSAKKCKGTLRLSLRNNQFEDTPIQLIGEGYEEDISIDNVRGQLGTISDQDLLQSSSSEEISAVKDNHLQFGDCAVKESRQIMFTITNNSSTHIYWFQWPNVSNLVIFPRTGHLHPGKSKDITVTFKANQPKTLKCSKVLGKLCQITYSKPLSQVPEWDDSMRSVKWITLRQASRGSEHQPPASPSPGALGSSTPIKPGSATGRSITGAPSQTAATKPPVTPAKKKVEEVDPEPSHSIAEDSQRDLELFVSAIADFAKYSASTTNIKFRDTFMYQTRSYSFSVTNTGKVTIHYQWSLVDDSEGSSTSMGELHLNDAGSIISEGGPCPAFTIEPASGKIPVGEEANFTVRYSPLDVQDMNASFHCVMSNLEESINPLMVAVQGRSVMPYCHFELEHSDYLISGRRSANQRGPFGSAVGTALDLKTKVIEFHSCGVGVKVTKSFSIINPTSQSYEFFWTNEDGIRPNKNAVFKCLTTKGFITGGKKFEVVFECMPNSLELVESFWRFSIPSLSLSTPFLLVANIVEPAINMDRAYLKFKSMLLEARSSVISPPDSVGTECHETVYLINDEDQPYSFSFVETSCYSDGHAAKVKVQPMSGTLQPNSKLLINVSFIPTQEREYNFNLQCMVKKKPTPIVLNVKAEGFLITYTLHYEDRKGAMVELPTGKGTRRRIELGKVELQEKCPKHICIINTGKYSFEYCWELIDTRGVLMKKSMADLATMTILPLEGTAEPNQKTMSELTFCPPTKMNLKGSELILKIKNVPSLPISLIGHGVEPVLDLSFSEHDFGPCFLHRGYMPPKQITLLITNKDKKDISLNCLFTNKPHLEVHIDPGVKASGKVTEATISFLPRDTVKYCETIWFEVNGLSRVPVIIKGEGTQMKVEVANPAQKVVSFGALSVGSKATKLVKVVNRSLTPITFTVTIAPSSTAVLQQDGMLSVAPTSEITLKANGGSQTIEVTFKPTIRVPSFSEEVMLECSGLSRPLFVVTGSCHGIEITLDTNHIPFGAVVLQSQSSRRVLLLNTGDIGARFKWNVAKFKPDFSITPVEGYISPGMEIPFDITFCPKQTNRDIRYEKVPCAIEGRGPLYITLTGTCIEQVPLKEVIHFTTTVRNHESRQITLHNRTTTSWLVRPIIDGEYWSGPNTISIEPGHPKHYELTYAPLRMTNDASKHHGSIFFPFPDGNGLLYNLLGTADAPKQAGTVYQEVPCKTSHTELLRVNNWLRRPQRFRAIVEMVKPEKQDRSVTLNGLDYIDVPALSKKDYKLNFYTYKEGSFNAKITFRNEQTGEYLFYNVLLKAIPPGTMATINLTTIVRKNVSETIKLFNPLPMPVTMNTNVTSQDINIPTSFIVGAESEGACMFEYLPLKVGETTAKLVLTSTELGLYQYELHLVASPSPPERTVHFTTTIGNSIQQMCKFTSFAKARTEYVCKLDNSDFHVERNITVASAGSSGTEATVEVTFEPSHLGDTKGNLTISSQSGGDYTIPLLGHCLVPKPQGPYTIKAGLNITIPFKNVFSQPTHFTFTVDNPVFSVKATETIKSKKVCNILVSFEKQVDPLLTKTGKLVVTCPQGTPGASSGLQWIYYLKGVVPQN